MLNLKPEEFDGKLIQFYETKLLKKCIDLRKQVLQDSKQPTDDYFWDKGSFVKPKSFKLKEKLMLALIHWYFPEEIKFTINLFLEETWGNERRELKEVLLSSKRSALTWFIIQNEFNERDFFGNYLVLNNFRNFLNLKFKKITKKRNLKKYTGWCRGPQDHSSRVDNITKRVQWRETEEDYQQRILEEIEFNNTVELIFLKIEEYYDNLA